MKRDGSFFKSFLAFFLATVVAFLVLLKLDLAGRLAYSIEKARLRAMREALPTAEEMARSAQASRLVAQVVTPAVVSIITERRVSRDDLGLIPDWARELHRFLQRDADTNGTEDEDEVTVRTGIGSGFIFSAEEGLILTNRHVVEGSDVIRVHLTDGREREAKLIGTDRMTDLAIIAIEADDLVALPLGDSEAMKVGDDVFAVGNPFGLGGSFSRGIISAKGRSNVNVRGIRYQKFIQTDAVINPGNSGGPLVNMRGEVIGINTAIATHTGTYGGVGFAIPMSRVKQLLPRLAKGEPIRRGFLGIEMKEVASLPEQAAALEWTEPYGVIVSRIVEDSPAARSGKLRVKDIVIEYDGQRVANLENLRETVAATPPGTRVPLVVWRDGKREQIQFEVGELPENF